jgi:hypothetical protein
MSPNFTGLLTRAARFLLRVEGGSLFLFQAAPGKE